ncbi:MAG: flagellar biosynthesis protein FlhF [Pseudomonadota bacterium]
MRIERYIADDTKTAMAKVRAELGSEAMILANRRVGGRVELTAGVDLEDAVEAPITPRQAVAPRGFDSRIASEPIGAYDPQSGVYADTTRSYPMETRARAPQDMQLQALEQEVSRLRGILQHELGGRPTAATVADQGANVGTNTGAREPRAMLRQRLLRLGLSRSLAEEIIGTLPPVRNLNDSWQRALRKLVSIVNTQALPADRDSVFALFGGTGVGKSSTIAKLAGADVQRFGVHGVGLITLDNYRIGAQEQMSSFAYTLGIPLYPANDRQSLALALQELQGRRVYIDTAGMGQHDDRLARQINLVREQEQPITSLLTLSASAQPSQSRALSSLFTRSGVTGAIITKVDEATSLGGILDVLIRSRLPLHVTCDGQRVPDDIQAADGQVLVRRAVELLRSEEPGVDGQIGPSQAPTVMPKGMV